MCFVSCVFCLSLNSLISFGCHLGLYLTAVYISISLAAIGRKRPLYYESVLSALLDFEPNFEAEKGGHLGSIQYSIRTAMLGFLRCTYPSIMEVILFLDILQIIQLVNFFAVSSY